VQYANQTMNPGDDDQTAFDSEVPAGGSSTRSGRVTLPSERSRSSTIRAMGGTTRARATRTHRSRRRRRLDTQRRLTARTLVRSPIMAAATRRGTSRTIAHDHA
jgi:hypothetical protein